MVKTGYQPGVYIYGSGTLTQVAQSLVQPIVLSGMSPSGLVVGSSRGTPAFAYDAATSQFYSIGPAGSWAENVNADGYVVGVVAGNWDGFVWQESTQTYTEIPGLAAAQGISNNNQYVVGLSQDSTSVAQEYGLSGNLLKLFGTAKPRVSITAAS